ncbi:MAG TPA: hypothetical protein PKE65_08155, partial [Rhizobiaceae bacterium]|nr:hypothetical protein [Rhizobiaceae bacterium]
ARPQVLHRSFANADGHRYPPEITRNSRPATAADVARLYSVTPLASPWQVESFESRLYKGNRTGPLSRQQAPVKRAGKKARLAAALGETGGVGRTCIRSWRQS